LVTIGRDFQEPIAPNTTEQGRQRNRRVAFALQPEQ
jgi:outer membrane protein OmpA-like peptidoglycan-associated protein